MCSFRSTEVLQQLKSISLIPTAAQHYLKRVVPFPGTETDAVLEALQHNPGSENEPLMLETPREGQISWEQLPSPSTDSGAGGSCCFRAGLGKGCSWGKCCPSMRVCRPSVHMGLRKGCHFCSQVACEAQEEQDMDSKQIRGHQQGQVGPGAEERT